jgi:hypothetical protein
MLRSNHDLNRQQQVQQYKNQIQTDKEDDVNLVLKTALEQVEGISATDEYPF